MSTIVDVRSAKGRARQTPRISILGVEALRSRSERPLSVAKTSQPLRVTTPHAEREEYIVPNKWGRKSIRSSGPQASRPRESCADFKKAGGPPFLDMRPSDVGRRLSLHVQSPPPNSLMRFWKFNFARGMRQFIRPQTPRTVLSFGSFFLGIDFGQSHALTGSARTLSA